MMHDGYMHDGQELRYCIALLYSELQRSCSISFVELTSQKAELCLNASKERGQISCGKKALKKS